MSEIKSIVVHLGKPTTAKPGGTSTYGYYKVEGNEVVMTGRNGQEVIGPNGESFRGVFGSKSGELNEREMAARLTKKVRSAFRHDSNRRPDGFGEAIVYPKGF
jgi:hypothetical protein